MCILYLRPTVSGNVQCLSPVAIARNTTSKYNALHGQYTYDHVKYFVLYLSVSITLLTAWAFQKRSRPQQLTLCWRLHAKAQQATVSEGLVQGPYVVARAGFERMTPVERHRLYQCATTPNTCASTIQHLVPTQTRPTFLTVSTRQSWPDTFGDVLSVERSSPY